MENKYAFEYRGYSGSLEFDRVAQVYHGRIQDIKGLITYEAAEEDELELAFQDAVNDYEGLN